MHKEVFQFQKGSPKPMIIFKYIIFPYYKKNNPPRAFCKGVEACAERAENTWFLLSRGPYSTFSLSIFARASANSVILPHEHSFAICGGSILRERDGLHWEQPRATCEKADTILSYRTQWKRSRANGKRHHLLRHTLYNENATKLDSVVYAVHCFSSGFCISIAGNTIYWGVVFEVFADKNVLFSRKQ